MKFTIRHICISFLSLGIAGTGISFAATDPVTPEFSYQTFGTCSELEATFKQILPTTYNDGRLYK